MPRPKKRRGFNRRGGLPERPHRLPQRIEPKGPTLIRHDYGTLQSGPGMNAIQEFDADRRRNPHPNRFIRRANESAFRPELQYDQGGRFPSNHLGERMYGQETSEIRRDDKGTFVWYAGDTDGLGSGASDQEWEGAGAVKVYGDFSKYSNSRSPFIHDNHDYIIRPTGDGSYELDEEQTQAQAGMEKGFNMAEEVQYDDRGTAKDLLERLNAVNRSNRGVTPGRGEREMAGEARGGMGASATEDLLERLSQYKRNAYGNKYEQGGVVKKKGSTIKIAGQYAYEPIATTESGEQYVTMELPDGTMATVFGDWETYGNPSQEGYIEDLDYVIYPLGDGTYALDAAEAEAEMLRDESREVSRQAGPEVEDLLQELNQRGGMGFTPSGRMRPVKRQ